MALSIDQLENALRHVDRDAKENHLSHRQMALSKKEGFDVDAGLDESGFNIIPMNGDSYDYDYGDTNSDDLELNADPRDDLPKFKHDLKQALLDELIKAKQRSQEQEQSIDDLSR